MRSIKRFGEANNTVDPCILPIWAGLAQLRFCHKASETETFHPLTSAPRDGSQSFMPKQPKIVAIVEDDPSMLRAARDLLDAHGFATVAFASAEEFLAPLRTRRLSPAGY